MYYNTNDTGMAQRYWKIPLGLTNTPSCVGFEKDVLSIETTLSIMKSTYLSFYIDVNCRKSVCILYSNKLSMCKVKGVKGLCKPNLITSTILYRPLEKIVENQGLRWAFELMCSKPPKKR